MEFKSQNVSASPRLIIHGGAGNIRPMPQQKYAQYRDALLDIITKTNAYMTTPSPPKQAVCATTTGYPSALDIATYAVVLLENNPLFNSGHGAVFTRDGINELEASVMVSRGFAKRGVGVTGLRRVRNPILLARKMLEHGEDDLRGLAHLASGTGNGSGENLDIPSAQGHTLVHGPSAELLATQYGMELVEPSYFFTQTRWDEHVRALEREKAAYQADTKSWPTATWSADEYLPQGTCGAVALDADGVICCATSTGGMTNKLTGRIGDTPSIGAGFWAEEWNENTDPTSRSDSLPWAAWGKRLVEQTPIVELSAGLRGMIAQCLPTPFIYQPVAQDRRLVTTRSAALSGTGNGDSFLRVAAVRTVVGIARWTGVSTAEALNRVAGRDGELQKSAGDRWGKTGEGEGGMIGIEAVVVRDAISGDIVEVRHEILQDFNCGGMFRAWLDDNGRPMMRIFDGVKDGDYK
ncbi:nucleophile aminohydrolase [Pestalotiopsis sp. NC0098]|nr:nucleophile aminohydrolase [Pestalotiopsis sp. NC0098]